MKNENFDLLKIYQKEINKYKPMDKETEREYLSKAKNGDIEARNKIINANLKFAFKIAMKYQTEDIPFSDILCEGTFGMAKAIERFDMEQDVKFICYAVWWIRQSIQEFIRNYNKIETCPEEANIRNESDDEHNEVCDGIDYSLMDDEDSTNEPQKVMDENMIKQLLTVLNKQERDIIEMYYGIGNEEPMTLTEIGDVLGLSRERIRQIKITAMRKMKSEIMLKMF